MKKPKIVLASVLKPVDDTRMFEKFALSLGQTNKYEINIIGFYTKKLPVAENIGFHPVFNFARLQFKRLFAPWKCFQLYVKLKPQVIIVNTHELLLITILYKIIFGSKIVYDIQENYYRNILYTSNYPFLLRPVLAGYIRAKEYLSRLFFDCYFLAEKAYENEFSFSHKKSIIIENKYRPGKSTPPKDGHTRAGGKRLLFSGTLAKSTGIFEAIELAISLHATAPDITLHIVGHSALPSVYQQINNVIKQHSFIALTGGNYLVPHATVLSAIGEADFGIIIYPESKSTMNTMPTKLYEYLGNHLPILLQNHQPWVDLCKDFNAALVLDGENSDPKKLLERMQNEIFYKKTTTASFTWKSEEKKLLDSVHFLLNK